MLMYQNYQFTWILSIRSSVISRLTFAAETCGGQMRVIAFITDYSAVDRIITLLKLTFHAERPPPPRVLQQEFLMAAEEQGEYF